MQPTLANIRSQYTGLLDWKDSTYYVDGIPVDVKLDKLLNTPITLFKSKRTPGIDRLPTVQTGVSAPLGYMLLECHADDMHFTQYTSPREARRIKGGSDNTDLKFGIVGYDYDYKSHAKDRPTEESLTDFIRMMWVNDYSPNIIYPTRGGARIIYFTEEFTDPDHYEGHYQALMTRLAESTAHSPYKLDTIAKDWTRMFRAPRVVRLNEQMNEDEELYDVPVMVMTDQPFSLMTLKPKPKPIIVKKAGHQKYTGADPFIVKTLRHVDEGNRNNALFRLVCHAYNTYKNADTDKIIDYLRGQFEDAGLSPSEIEATINSANHNVNREVRS